MGRIDDLKPALAMVGLQFSFAGVNLFTTPTGSKGSMVFVFYGQLIATLFLVTIAFVSKKEKLVKSSLGLGLKSFGWILLLASFLGIAGTQNMCTLLLYLASSTLASAMTNLAVPALTFIMATFFGLEKISIKGLGSVAKIVGTILCVSGAISTLLVEGPKLLYTEMLPNSLFSLGGGNLLLGCLLLIHSSFIWSCWNVVQVPRRPDYLSSSCWMCFLAALHSGIIALLVERKVEAWSVNSYLELACCFYTGIVTAGSFCVQAWCISERGPLYSVMYQPLATGFVAFFAAIFLHTETHTGSLSGAFAVIIGLYVLLWGKTKDLEDMIQETDSMLFENQSNVIQVVIEECSEKNCRINLEEPLLSETSNN
ncbi:Drug/metabolite transporter [Corchorus olitorius]|uniref:WAT1-related protein n=2 Tax=Corchorus olitorius TaxID=93759 RepID=A0A1R3GPH8_9ROSI|nr:Drug/metabolite transporter [Corchorus olitorius]